MFGFEIVGAKWLGNTPMREIPQITFSGLVMLQRLQVYTFTYLTVSTYNNNVRLLLLQVFLFVRSFVCLFV
jgi:hypothetical protein